MAEPLFSPAAAPDDADLSAAAPPPSVRIASGLVMVAGLAAVLVGVQTLLGYQTSGLYFALPLALALLGVGAIAIGWQHGRARAPVASLVLVSMVFLTAAVWVLVSLLGGGISILALGTVALAGLGVVVVPFTIPACRRTAQAQARLRAAGLDLGL